MVSMRRREKDVTACLSRTLCFVNLNSEPFIRPMVRIHKHRRAGSQADELGPETRDTGPQAETVKAVNSSPHLKTGLGIRA